MLGAFIVTVLVREYEDVRQHHRDAQTHLSMSKEAVANAEEHIVRFAAHMRAIETALADEGQLDLLDKIRGIHP